MLGPGSIPLADLLGFLNSFAVVLLVGAALLVLCELAILLGALIGNLVDESRKPNRALVEATRLCRSERRSGYGLKF